MKILFQILLLRLFLFARMGTFLPITYVSPNISNRIGCSIKFDKSVTTPYLHPVTGKILFYKPDYSSVTFTLFKGGMAIDHWQGSTLYTYHGKSNNEKSFLKRLLAMTEFYVQLVGVASKYSKKD
jgi:hypothetical protein